MKLFHYDTVNLTGEVLCALINGDDSALESYEIEWVDQFEKRFEGFYVTYETIEDDEGSFTECDVLGDYANCYDVNIHLQLIHNADQINYLPELFINRIENTAKPRSNNVSGYGSKLPTDKLIHCADGFKRRVYARCYGNAASQYIIVQGKEFYL